MMTQMNASPGGLAATLILIALFLPPSPGFSATISTDPPKPEASAATTKAEPAPALSEILTGLEAVEAGERKLRHLLTDEQRVRALSSEVDQVGMAFAATRTQAGHVLNDVMGYRELIDISDDLWTADRRLSAAIDELAAKASALDAGLDRIAAADAKAATWREAARTRNAPPAVLADIQALPARSESLARELRAHRDRILDVLARATQLRGTINVQRAEVSGHREQIAIRVRGMHGYPIWRVEPHPGEWPRVVGYFATRSAQTARHVREHAVLLLAIAILAFALAYWLIVVTREPLAAQAETDPHVRRASELFRIPAVAALAAALLAVLAFGPAGPLNYRLLLLGLVLAPGALLARAAIGPQVALSVYTLMGVLISLPLLGVVFEALPLTGRLLIIAQCVVMALALGVDLGRGRFEQAFPGLPVTFVRSAAAGTIFLLVVAVAAIVTGYVGAANVLRNAVFSTLGLGTLLHVLVELLYGFALALMQTRVGRSLRIVRLHQHAVRKGLRLVLTLVALSTWAAGTLLVVGLADEVSQLVNTLYHAEITIGSTSIDLTGVWTGLAVIVGTYVVVKIVGPVLEVEILPRLTSKQGIPFAVSTVFRYLLVTAGVLLAMAAMGIDLTKVTVLAGAVGVGIGFGLQSVINNFVSGLILLVERPINVGDVVQMGQLRGVIQRIGVRSVTVHTGQGAEVIVPNADLISKEVTNWTLSDRKRRLEIDVGVAYGTEPEQVLRLLEAAAAEVREVLPNPAPSASFTGFGESAQNFRLQAWIDDYALSGAVETALRTAIVKKFGEANIEIPPPQRERPMRTAPAAPGS